MPPPPTLADLVARLAFGPPRWLDAEIGVAVGHLRRVRHPNFPGHPVFRVGDGASFRLHGPWRWTDRGATDFEVPPYTFLIDAALTLYRGGPPARVPSDPCAACAEALRGRLEER